MALLDTLKVAEYLQLSPSTVRQWRTRGEGPPWIKLPAGGVRYESTALAAWVDSGRKGGASVDGLV